VSASIYRSAATAVDRARYQSAAPTRSAKLRGMLQSPQLEFLMESHNGLSARIVREAGFGGIWAPGLSISARFGVRDNNEASWTQVVDVLEFMADASDLPILLDGDTDYGNFNNMRRLVRKLEQRGIAASVICAPLYAVWVVVEYRRVVRQLRLLPGRPLPEGTK
jgi:phosphoenolpyruvate phosphomutase